MTIKLPPKPEMVQIDRHIPTNYVIRGYTAEQMGAYATESVRAALAAQPAEQEPVAYIPLDALEQMKAPRLILKNVPLYAYQGVGTVPLYTAPQPRKRLTLKEIDRALDLAGVPKLPAGYESVEIAIARAIERAHGIGETK